MSYERPLTQLSHHRSLSTTDHKLHRSSRHDNRLDRTTYEELCDLLAQAKDAIYKGIQGSALQISDFRNADIDDKAQDINPFCKDSEQYLSYLAGESTDQTARQYPNSVSELHHDSSIGQHLVCNIGSPESADRRLELPDFCHTTDVMQLIKISEILLESYHELMGQAER